MTNTQKCCICHRTLKDPASIKRGYGPECARKYQVKSARTRAFQTHQKFTAGKDFHTREPNTYQPLDDGNWIDRSGQIVPNKRLENWLESYGFIHTNIVAKTS